MPQTPEQLLPSPVTSGLSSWPIICQPSPFAASYPIELQQFEPPIPSPHARPLTNDEKKRWETEKKKRAWKHEGYKEFSRWMASDDDFFVIRRFQRLNANVILYMQDRLSQIEERLGQIHDNNANAPDDRKRKNSSFRWDLKHEAERDKLFCELTGLLHHYNEYVKTFSEIRNRPKADERQLKNLENFLASGGITEKERSFAKHKQDLMSINPHKSSPLGRFLEATPLIRLSRLVRAKPDPESQVISSYTHYASDDALARLTTCSITLLGLGMLLGPMWWLECVSKSTTRLLIITLFLTLFTTLMSTATVNRPFEVVAASAAYAAVLMVFMQIDSKA